MYEYLAYLSSSALGLMGEPPEYGPIRLLEAMRRFIDLVFSLNIPIDEETRKELKDLREKVTRGIALRRVNPVEFKDFLEELNKGLAKTLLKILRETNPVR